MDLFKLFNKRIILTKEKVLFLEIEKKILHLWKKHMQWKASEYFVCLIVRVVIKICWKL